MANRMLQEDSDARLEAIFASSPQDEEGALPDAIGQVNSWDDGAAQVADMIGAEVCCAYRCRMLVSCAYAVGWTHNARRSRSSLF